MKKCLSKICIIFSFFGVKVKEMHLCIVIFKRRYLFQRYARCFETNDKDEDPFESLTLCLSRTTWVFLLMYPDPK